MAVVLWFRLTVVQRARVLSLVQCSFHGSTQRRKAGSGKGLTDSRITVFNGDEQKRQVPAHQGIGFAVYLCLPNS